MADLEFKDFVDGLTEDTAPSVTADFVITKDTSADALKKVKPTNLLAALVDSAPGALDTLNELAAALGDDANFAATVTTALAGKAPLTGVGLPCELIIAISDESTDLTTGVAKVTFRMPFAMTLNAGGAGVRANVNTAPTGAALIVDINEGGSTILSTKLSIDASEKTSTTAASAAVISDTALADDAEITIDIDQVGSTIAGKGLKVILRGVR